MTLLTFTRAVELDRPVMISALGGWVDAASVATEAAQRIAGDADVVAYFDADELFDYRSSRPILDIVEGAMTDVTWPEITMRQAELGGKEVLVMLGTEPDLRWRAFSTSVVEFAQRHEVSLHVTLEAVPAAVPHTLPPPVLTTASREGLLGEKGPLPHTLRVPSAAISIVDRALARAGVDTVGFFAQIPHYVNGPYHDAIATLIGRLAGQIGVEVQLDDLHALAAEQRSQLDDTVAARPDAKEYVARLEAAAVEDSVPSGDELAEEFQRYFSQQDPGPNDPFEG